MNMKLLIIMVLIALAVYLFVLYWAVGMLLTMIYPEVTKLQIIAATFLVSCIIGALNNRSK